MPAPMRASANARVEAKYNVVTDFPNFDLHSAAAAGNIGLVEYALARGQPINSIVDGVLPFHAACAGGDEQVVKLLIEHGADVNAPRLPRRYSNDKNRDTSAPIVGTSGSTPLHFAAANGNKNIIQILLLRGAHANRADKHGITPEMLARQHGWLECAELLRSWIENKDKDLREREGQTISDGFVSTNGGRERGGSFGVEPEGHTAGRKRLKVKRSIDTAFGMLKVSSTGLSDAYTRTPLHSSPSLITPPASPNRARGDSMPSPLHDGKQSPSPMPIDPNARRPSLPHIFSTAPSDTLISGINTPPSDRTRTRRPRSAGTDAEPYQHNAPYSVPYGRGGAGRLGTKYSLLNLFKKAQTPEGGIPSEKTSSNMPSPHNIVSELPNVTDSPVSSSPPTGSSFKSRFRMGSDPSARNRVPSTSQQLRTSPSISNLSKSPGRPPMPAAVELQNGLSQLPSEYANSLPEQMAYTSRGEADNSLLSSPPHAMRTLLRANSRHSRNRSGSGESSTHRNAMVFEDEGSSSDIVSSTQGYSSRPGILRAHNRSSSGQSHVAARALRFDSSSSQIMKGKRDNSNPQLRGSNSAGSLKRFKELDSLNPESKSPRSGAASDHVPDSAPAFIGEFPDAVLRVDADKSVVPDEDGLDEDSESIYGHTVDESDLPGLEEKSPFDSQTRARGFSITSSNSSISPMHESRGTRSSGNAEFPFSINRPPPAPLEDSTTSSSHLQVPVSPPVNRCRGESFSSVSSLESQADHSVVSSTGYISDVGDDVIDAAVHSDVGSTLNEHRGNSVLGIEPNTIASHAQAEALVQRAQQDILNMSQDFDTIRPSNTLHGRSPLSARLAAYGESLALERKLREQIDVDTENKPVESLMESQSPIASALSATNSTPTDSLFPKVKQPRRPHTSSGTHGAHEDSETFDNETKGAVYHSSHSTSEVDIYASIHSLDSDGAHTITEDTPHVKVPTVFQSYTPAPSLEHLSRVNSLEIDTDTELGPTLFRVSTTPTSLGIQKKNKNSRDQIRNVSSSTKLARMGFAPTDAARSPTPVGKQRFGGLKSLVQSLKGKP